MKTYSKKSGGNIKSGRFPFRFKEEAYKMLFKLVMLFIYC